MGEQIEKIMQVSVEKSKLNKGMSTFFELAGFVSDELFYTPIMVCLSHNPSSILQQFCKIPYNLSCLYISVVVLDSFLGELLAYMAALYNLFLFLLWGETVWNWAANGPIVHPPDDKWVNMEQWWNNNDSGKPSSWSLRTDCMFI